MELLNLSPYSVQPLLAVENGGMETLLVVVKAVYALGEGEARLAEKQEAIRVADEYHGEPGDSSVRFAAETSLRKSATDVVLLGSAVSPGGEARVVDVELQAGKIRKTVRVFGERRWEGKGGSERISAPLPFERIPLVFERCFGGVDDSDETSPEADPRNPVGTGFRARRSRRPVAGTLLPNLEDPARPIRTPSDRPPPAGTAFVAPHWEPRRTRGGTYDAKWIAERAPFLPDDYDPLFQQAAPPDQVYPGYMEGGEPVVVENASPDGRLEFRLPSPRLEIAVRVGEDRHPIPVRLDTVVIDGEAQILRMLWRGSLPVHNKVYEVAWIRVAGGEET